MEGVSHKGGLLSFQDEHTRACLPERGAAGRASWTCDTGERQEAAFRGDVLKMHGDTALGLGEGGLYARPESRRKALQRRSQSWEEETGLLWLFPFLSLSPEVLLSDENEEGKKF